MHRAYLSHFHFTTKLPLPKNAPIPDLFHIVPNVPEAEGLSMWRTRQLKSKYFIVQYSNRPLDCRAIENNNGRPISNEGNYLLTTANL